MYDASICCYFRRFRWVDSHVPRKSRVNRFGSRWIGHRPVVEREQLFDPYIPVDVVPELHLHPAVVEDAFIVRIVHLVLFVGSLVVRPPLLVILERRQALIFPNDEVAARLLPRDILVEAAQALPFGKKLPVLFDLGQPLAHRLGVLLLFAFLHGPALDFEYRHRYFTRLKLPISLPYCATSFSSFARSGSVSTTSPASPLGALAAAPTTAADSRKRRRVIF